VVRPFAPPRPRDSAEHELPVDLRGLGPEVKPLLQDLRGRLIERDHPVLVALAVLHTQEQMLDINVPELQIKSLGNPQTAPPEQHDQRAIAISRQPAPTGLFDDREDLIT
jgi:hypothetical protein